MVKGISTFKIKSNYDSNVELRCSNNHPMWFLYHKRVRNATDTIVCCSQCDRESVGAAPN
jgi:hypothetical protein